MISDPKSVTSVVVQASAGSGKTFALSNQYLRLLATGVNCESILATTFTRKAAGEILDRIMQRLNAAAASPENCAALSKELDIPLSVEQATEILRGVASNLHRLQISTLDSFFNTVARAYSFELNLPPDWEVVESGRIDQLSGIALQKVLHKQNVRQFVRMITRFDADRRIAEVVSDQVNSYFEIYRTSTTEAWSPIKKRPEDYENRLSELCELFAQYRALDSRVQKSFDRDLAILSERDLEQFCESKLALRVLSGITDYYNKPMPAEILSFYRAANEVAADYLSNEYLRRTQSAYQLIDSFQEELWPMQMEIAQVRFSDVPYVLQSVFDGASEFDFEYRVDQQIDHLLLDEFQDTSPAQWQILRPIALGIMQRKEPGTFFCVGDKKQAIYAWRGGVAEIFDVVENQLGKYLEPAPVLAKSWRSSPVVIDAVNLVFASLSERQVEESPDKGVLSEWQQNFPHHTTARESLPGWVRVEVPEEPSDDEGMISPKDSMYLATVNAIESLCNAAPDKTIGVLVGGHDDISRILFYLHLAKIPASAEGGNSLTDSAAVNIVLSMLKFIDHPGDDVARFHLSHSPLAEALGLQPEDIATQTANETLAGDIANRLRRELAQTGFGTFVEAWSELLRSHCTNRESRRLDQLIEFAFDFHEPWTIRTNVFLDQLDRANILDPTNAQVRVMTIHAAKGLEFDAVIAPLLGPESRWRGQSPELIYHRSDPAKQIDLVFRYAKRELQDYFPENIQVAFASYRSQEIREQLCLLYVLMTRAINHLQIILPRATKGNRAGIASVLLDTLGSKNGNAKESNIIFESGDPKWYTSLPLKEESQQTNVQLPFFDDFDKNSIGLNGQTAGKVTPSPAFAKSLQKASLSKYVRGSANKSSIHDSRNVRLDCLALIEWWETQLTTGHLKKCLKDLGYDRTEIEFGLRFVASIPQRPGLFRFLSRRSYQDEVFKNRYSSSVPLFEPLKVDVADQKLLARLWSDSLSLFRVTLFTKGDEQFGAEITGLIDNETSTATGMLLQQFTVARNKLAEHLQLPTISIWCRAVNIDTDSVIDYDL